MESEDKRVSYHALLRKNTIRRLKTVAALEDRYQYDILEDALKMYFAMKDVKGSNNKKREAK